MSDCVDFALLRAARYHGIDPLPDPRTNAALLRAVEAGVDEDWLPGWEQVEAPRDGDIVLLRTRASQHVGFVVGGYVEHFTQGVEQLTPLARVQRLILATWRRRICDGPRGAVPSVREATNGEGGIEP